MKRIRPVLAVLAAVWGSVGVCNAQAREDMSAWRFPEARALIFPTPTALAGRTTDLQVQETPFEIRIEMSADVLFDFDKATLSEKAQDSLQQAASIIREKAKGQVRIDGHTDGKGDERYNLSLSERRADAVKIWFVKEAGLPSDRVATRGFGKQQPLAKYQTRRVR